MSEDKTLEERKVEALESISVSLKILVPMFTFFAVSMVMNVAFG